MMNIYQVKKMIKNEKEKKIKDLLLNYLKMMINLGKTLNNKQQNEEVEQGIINTFDVLQEI